MSFCSLIKEITPKIRLTDFQSETQVGHQIAVQIWLTILDWINTANQRQIVNNIMHIAIITFALSPSIQKDFEANSSGHNYIERRLP